MLAKTLKEKQEVIDNSLDKEIDIEELAGTLISEPISESKSILQNEQKNRKDN